MGNTKEIKETETGKGKKEVKEKQAKQTNKLDM